MKPPPLVSIIVPHYRGKEILYNCLDAVFAANYANREVILVDNATVDDSLTGIEKRYPELQVVRNAQNLGYAGGCNSGLAQARGTYVVFLNDDTVVPADWLALLVETVENDNSIAAAQPKILSLSQPGYFDYAGGAGGLLDKYGYPFAKGRIFFSLEKDDHQYDQSGDIFWASGTAMLVRKSVLDEIGTFDEDFFAHMEEIDLCWRMHLAGYRVVTVPRAVIFHHAGSTLKPDSPQKLYLNHRNSLLMILKNYQAGTLIKILPVRIGFEIVTLFYALVKRDINRLVAATKALFHVCLHGRQALRKRGQIDRIRKVGDRELQKKLYCGSIVLDYFVKGVTRASELGY